MSERINSPLAQEFHAQGMEAMNHLILDEQQAKEMLLANAILGHNALLVGAPGGGKTTASEHFYRIFSDIDEERVAVIPAMPDLKAEQLVGAEMVSSHEIKNGGHPVTEERRINIEPLVKSNVQMIYADEINRTNPYALDAVLSALATNTRRLATTAGTIPLNDLEFAIATQNPAASNQATFHLDPAVASRFSMGAVLGGDRSDAQARRERIVNIGGKNRWVPSPDKIEAFTSTVELKEMRSDAERVYIPNSLEVRYADLCIRALDSMRDFKKHARIEEADGRFADQVSRIAGALSLMGGETTVQEIDLNRAVGYAMTARLGGLTRASYSEITDVVSEVTKSE